MSDPAPMSLTVPTQKTQEFDELNDSQTKDGDHTEQSRIWGRLLSINKLFSPIDLIDNEYSFGRGKTCSVVLNSNELQTSKYFGAYSSCHFSIIRDQINNQVYLLDSSSNGTYVNGDKVGKNNKYILENNAEIALPCKNNRVFIYIDTNAKEDMSIPNEVRQKYIISKQLGRGTYGEVRLCFTKGTCTRFAMKIVAKKRLTHNGPQALIFNENMKTECLILQRLHHPFIIRIHDVIDTQDALFIILELVEGGELFNRIVSQGQFNEITTKFLFRQMAIGVKYLHDNSITHRDLKPENILLTSTDLNESLIKITDFGLSRLINEASLMKTFCGTPNYLAPEVLVTHGEGSYTNKVDVWSLGVILFICLVGYPPFCESPDSPPLTEQILKGLYTFPDAFWSDISDSAKDLVRQMMCVDPNKRLTIASVLEHPWLAHDLENTARVDELLSPTVVQSRSAKRRADMDETCMDNDEPLTTILDDDVGVRAKRTKV